ncbi:rhomboid family membrane protein [Phlyctema vagabunda]|uniref:Rhomboid-type serine protease n=1 Tax=Phlyctema vagabunda TaxID=108571 RepID=A0ABR4P606_9HELO
MASNDYYNPHAQQQQQHPDQNQAQPTQPYYESYNDPARPPLHSYNSTAPSYHSQAPQPPTGPSPVSPFEAPFDDHVYPLGGPATAHNYNPQDSQSSFGQDSRYYGQGGGGRPQDSTNSFPEDIPLQNQSQHPAGAIKHQQPLTDHVYDAGESGIPPGATDGRHKRRSAMGTMFQGKGPKKRVPWVVYIFTIIQTAVFIAEIVKNAQLTGSPIEIKPSFNPMIGPSPWVLINMGSRYMPCMHNVVGIQDSSEVISWGCPNTTSNTVADCTLSDLCGFGGVPNPKYNGDIKQSPEPDQWYRFILPMFLHAGLIHIGFNMLLQLTLGKEMEIAIGPIRFFLVYLASGIFGFVLGGNFAATGISSTGASGSLFGVIALTLLDLLYTWSERVSPFKDLAFIILDIVISFVLGLLPGLDNFSHIGGFLMGLVLGICILHSPNALRARISQDPPYTPVDGQAKFGAADGPQPGVQGFVKSPLGFFKGRKPAWWAWWLLRAGALVAVFVVFIVLLNNFYKYRKTCSWCKYLSCLPINGWCEIGNIKIT